MLLACCALALPGLRVQTMAPGASKHTSGEAERLRRRYRQKAPPTVAYLVREEVLATAYAWECSDATVSARVLARILVSKI